jgi:hypothetical protein
MGSEKHNVIRTPYQQYLKHEIKRSQSYNLDFEVLFDDFDSDFGLDADFDSDSVPTPPMHLFGFGPENKTVTITAPGLKNPIVTISPEEILKADTCPYCLSPLLETVIERWSNDDGEYIDFDKSRSLASRGYDCPKCGWWNAERTRGYVDSEWWEANTILWEGVVFKFDLEGLDTPLTVLRRELQDRIRSIDSLTPYQMEKLVGSILRDLFDCEVRHVGGPKDQGVDLLLVDGDKKTVVQVKRRLRTKKAERVSVIREFIGAMILNEVSLIKFY